MERTPQDDIGDLALDVFALLERAVTLHQTADVNTLNVMVDHLERAYLGHRIGAYDMLYWTSELQTCRKRLGVAA